MQRSHPASINPRVVGTLLLSLWSLWFATPGAAQVTCTPDPGYNTCVAYTQTGADQSFTVPPTVTSLKVKAWGAGGGGSSAPGVNVGAPAGSGGYVEGVLAVTPGTQYVVVTGEGGGADNTPGASARCAAAYGFGGACAPVRTGGNYVDGGGGGGLSGLFTGTAAVTAAASNRAIFIAGGGGAGEGTAQCGNGSAAGGAGGNTFAGTMATMQGVAGAFNPATNATSSTGGGGGYRGGAASGRLSTNSACVQSANGGSNFVAGTGVSGAVNLPGAEAPSVPNFTAKTPPRATEPQYVAGVGVGSVTIDTPGGDGLVVLQWADLQGCNLAPNGSFESPNIQGDPAAVYFTAGGVQYASYRTSVGTLNGWTVTGGNVDHLRHYNSASDGVQSIDMFGTQAATIQQTFTGLTPGQTYTFSIDYSGIDPVDSRARVELDNGGTQVLTTLAPAAAAVPNPSQVPQYNATWRTYTYAFVAAGTQATIRFITTSYDTSTNTGVFLDNFKFVGAGACPAPINTCSVAQTRATQRYWYFGENAGIDFGTSGTTATPLLGKQLSFEGTTVVTDTAGQLLFWSNGQTVFDRNSDPMSNGTGLNGAPSATQTVAAFPALGQPGKYFVVTTSADVFVTGPNGRLFYAIVDMSLNGGLGAVTTKNVPLGAVNTASEALVAVPNATGTGFWVLTFTNNSPNILAYEFNASGPTGLVTTSVLPSANGNIVGTLNFSADLTQLVQTTVFDGAPYQGLIRLLAFNAATGQITERMSWNPGAPAEQFQVPYSADFSPSGDYVYATRINQGGRLYRYRIAGAATGAQVKATEQDLGAIGSISANLMDGGQVRRGPDGRMYVADYGAGTLSVVNAPDAAAPNYVAGGFALAPGALNRYGLPQMVTGCPTPVSADLAVTKTDNSATYTPGGNVTYTIVVTNNGPNTVTAAQINDPLPAGITTASWTCSAAAGGSACGAASGTGAIATTANLPSGGSVTYTLTMAVPAAQTGTLQNVVTVATPPDITDPNPANNSATDADTAAPIADLQMTKVGPATAVVGSNVSYTLTVTNNGPSVATTVSVSDPTPTGTTFVSNSGDCTTAFPCALGTLAPGETRTITTTFAVPVGYNSPTLSNTAAVGTSTPDPTPGNNSSTVTTGVDISADVAVTKSVTPSSGVLVGDQVTFTIGASNNGPNTATGVVITDVLPAGFVFVSATPSQGTYTQGNGAWQIGTLAVGAPPVTLDIVARVTQPGALTNSAAKTAAQQPDPNTANDTAVASINAAPSADVGVSKTVDNTSPSVGDIVSFTILAVNNGPSAVTSLTVTDQLPAGLTFQSAMPGQGAYDVGTGVWTIGALAVNASATLTLTAQVATAGPLVNTVTRTSQTEADVNPANDTASVSLNAMPSADLQVTKGASMPSPAVGMDVTFTVTVRNNGPSPATGVVVNDPLPAGLTFVSAVPSQGSYTSATGVWTVGTLAATQAATLTVTATVAGPAPASITNTATGTSSEPDPSPGNNTGSSTVTSQLVADLVISKTDGLTTVIPGQPVTYTIVVSNRGPSPVNDAPVSDTFPAALLGLTWTCAATAPANCDVANGAGPIAATVDLPAGGQVIFTATGTVDPATPGGTLDNTATVAAPAGATDSDPSNNNATDSSTIVPTADVQITKSGPANVVAGTNVTYTLTVTNNGPSVATAVSVNDPAPTGLTFVSATAPCVGGVTPCAIGTLAVGASASFSVTYAVPPGYTTPDPITNTATVATTATDPAPGNNSASAQTALAAPVTDLAVTKTNSVSTIVPGTTTTYTIVVTNAGPSDAVDATVTDTLDPAKIDVAGVTWTCVATGAASCGAPSGSGNINTTVSIAAGGGDSVTITVQAPVRADATGVLVNAVAVTAGPGQSDPNSTNDTDSDTLTPEADLGITKTGPATVTPGASVTYTITVTNHGPSNAEGVIVNDATPAGLTFVANAGDCTTAFPCALGMVPAGATRTITTTFTAPAGYTAPDPVVNTATVSAATPDTVPANNSATATASVAASADLRITKVAPPQIIPGTTASYTLTVVNDGPSVAQNVQLDDPAPAGLTAVAVEGVCTALPCTLPTLAVGAPVTLTVRFAVPANYTAPNPIVNTATATSPTTDPDPSSNTSTTTTPLGAARADLSVEKSGPTTVAPGGAVNYSIVIRNAGPSDVVDGVLTDVLPVGVTFVSLTTPPSGTCTTGGTITCTGLVLPVGGSITLTLSGTVAPDLAIGAVLTNVVTVTSPATTDPTPDNNRDEVDSRVGAATEADLAITKIDADDPVAVGGIVTYFLNVTNYGPATATNVTIDDPLPAGLTLVSVGGPCAALPCVIPSMAAGDFQQIAITATATAPGSVTNTATVSADQPDPVPSNNTATEQTTIAANPTDADLSVVKTGPARAGVGEAILYTITATNRGPGAAADVQVEDSVPAGLTVTSATASQGTCSIGASVICALGTIPAEQSVQITVLATVSTPGPLTNSAAGTSTTPDPDPSNNTSTVTTDVTDPAAADLAITKVDSPDAVVAGTTLQYVLTVTNRGPGTAIGATVNDPLPAGMTAASATSSVGSCTAGTTVNCTLGDLAPGAVVTIAIQMLTPNALPSPNPMINTATVTSAAADPDSSNNTATEPTTVIARADVAIVKTATTPASPGRPVTYQIVVTNNGPSIAEGVVIADPTPPGLSFVTASAPCAGGFPCALPTIAPGVPVTITVTYQVPASYTAPDPIVNVATATSPTPDPDPGNNTSTSTTPLEPAISDLTMVKTGPSTVQRGGQATYVLTVTNNGPADAAGVTLQDPTPAGLTFVSASAPCTSGFPCAIGTVPFGSTVSVSVTVAVPSNYSGPPTITNTACVASVTADPASTDNCDTVTTPLVEVADIQVTKTVDRVTPAVGEEVTFTVTVFNAGPSAATGVAITDAMPSALAIVASTPSQGTFDPVSGLWIVGSLANGASATLQIRARVTAAGEHVNIAAKTAGDQLDPDPSNNRGSSALTPEAVADVRVSKTANVEAVSVGSPVTFTITASNAGPSQATGVRVTEVLPTGLTFVSATPSAGTFDAAAGVWEIGTLAANAQATLTVEATVTAAGAIVNRARMTSNERDPDPGNNEDGSVVNGESADIQVVKTVSAPATVTVGQEVTYFITASNNGPGVATGLRIEERLPAGLAFVAATATRGIYVPQSGIWEIGTLDAVGAGATAVLELRAVITATTPIVNHAHVATSDQPDPNPSNNGSETTITGSALDLAVDIVALDDSGAVGRPANFHVTARNVSDATSTEPITIAVPLPAEYSYVPTTTPGWNCTLVVRTVFCQTMASLAPGQEVGFDLRVNVNEPLPWGRAMFAHLTHRPDTVARNNVAQVYIGPPPYPDPNLALSQTVQVTGTGPTRTLTYTVAVQNHGPIEGDDLVLTDAIPAGTTLVSATGPNGPCDVSGSFVSCNIGHSYPGHHAFVTIVLTAPAPGVVIHTVSASAEAHDMYPRDNQTVLVTALEPPADVDSDGDGMTDAWESLMGLSVLANDAGGDADGDGVSNLDEFERGTHPRGFYKQYFAEGVGNTFFTTSFGLLNLSATQSAGVLVEYMLESGTIVSDPLRLDPIARATRNPYELLGGVNRTYSALVESDQPIAADRTVSWDATGYGAHSEVGQPAASQTWYFGEGATGPFELFYLLQNPNAAAANVDVTFLREQGAPVTQPVRVEPFSRYTLRVNELPELATGSMSTVLQADAPIVAERAMYFGPGFLGGTAAAGAPSPSTNWFFAEGATGGFFEEFVLIANPHPTQAAEVTALFARPDGQTVTRPYRVAPQSRFTILVDSVDPLIEATPVAVTLTSTNGVPVVAERAMYWPDGAWQDGHSTLGATTTGQTWAVGSGTVGGDQGAQTYVLVANTSAAAGRAQVTVVFDDGERIARMVDLVPYARFTVDIGATFPEAVGRTFSVIVDSQGATPVPIVVESARYWSTPDIFWASGTSALATKVR